MAKRRASKTINVFEVYSDKQWSVNFGELKYGPGRHEAVPRLFKALGEKLPFEALNAVWSRLKKEGIPLKGVYIAHDSMSYARYIGRGNIFQRLRGHRNSRPLELKYFSFYVVEDKKHEREIETLLIRAAGPMLYFNTRKKALSINVGSVKDYEVGTLFFERNRKKGRSSGI